MQKMNLLLEQHLLYGEKKEAVQIRRERQGPFSEPHSMRILLRSTSRLRDGYWQHCTELGWTKFSRWRYTNGMNCIAQTEVADRRDTIQAVKLFLKALAEHPGFPPEQKIDPIREHIEVAIYRFLEQENQHFRRNQS